MAKIGLGFPWLGLARLGYPWIEKPWIFKKYDKMFLFLFQNNFSAQKYLTLTSIFK
jgi:hypothetical protein